MASLCGIVSCVCKSYSNLGKIGIEGVDSNLGTAIRTSVVLLMAWMMVIVTGKYHQIKEIEKKKKSIYVFRTCHRCILDVLLPGIAKWSCQCSSAH